MERQSSINLDPASMVVVNYSSLLLPPSEYSMVFTNFPGANAHPPHQQQGTFFFSFEAWHQGKLYGVAHTSACDERGFVHYDFDELKELLPKASGGLLRSQLHCSRGIPIEMYMSHVHRKTGVYFSYPMLAFAGEDHPYHSEQMENTLFWPGITNNEHTQFGLCVLNPYKVAISFELHLFKKDRKKIKSDVMRVRSLASEIIWLEDVYKEDLQQIESEHGQSSLCISAQYKMVAYVIFKDRRTGAITSADHLHAYCLV